MIKYLKYNGGKLRKLFVFIMIILTIYFVFSCNIIKAKVLVIEDRENNEKLEFNLPNYCFSLGYIHSVMKTPVEEFFYINENNQIVLEKISYESYGVGTPFLEEEGELEIIGDKFILKVNRVFSDINMIISPIPNHWLLIEDKKYEFNDVLKPNSKIKIYIDEIYKLESFLN